MQNPRVKAVLHKVLFAVVFMGLAIASYAIYDRFIKVPVVAIADEYADEDMNCSVVGINLHGGLLTYIPPKSESGGDLFENTDVVSSEEINYIIKQANEDDSVKAILLEVDSPGGLPVAGEEIANALKNSSKPTVGVIRSSGLSAAYWAVSGAEHIFASRNSDVGSIGVTSSYLENVGKNLKDGNDYVQLSSGKYKDAGDPDKPLTDEEKQLFLRDIKIVHQNFIADVAANRDIPIADVQKMADGSSVLGDKAKALHLIDDIGGLPEAEKYIEGIIGEKPEVCWY
ncbi:S49 family peptidase [Candidatus Uhrbacteria bacterium]|nr:S49 family peptidase [Candidatus Uhrbacteria bacterium]